jgi:hypothetical protein
MVPCAHPFLTDLLPIRRNGDGLDWVFLPRDRHGAGAIEMNAVQMVSDKQ